MINRKDALCLTVLVTACAAPARTGPSPAVGNANPPLAETMVAGAPGAPPPVVRGEPLAKGSGGQVPPGLQALADELRRGFEALKTRGAAAPYFIQYEVYDRRDLVITASNGALVQTQERRARVLDTDVRVGDHSLDSTHPMRAEGFDLGLSFGRSASLPLEDDLQALRAVAWIETDRKVKAAAERFVKVRAQRAVKVAEEDQSDDFSREQPVRYIGSPAVMTVDVPAWQERLRRLSQRFRRQGELGDSQVSLQTTTLNRWIVNSDGSIIQTGRNYARVSMQADTRADDGMELERFESFDADSVERLAPEAEMEGTADVIVRDLLALRRAPLADPYIGPAILEGRAAAVFFHEIFGHRVEGHRQKDEEEGQTFAKKIGQPIMPPFISVYDDPTLVRVGGLDLNGFYRFDDEGVMAQRASLVDHGVLTGFLLSRSPTRGFKQSNGHGRRQEGRAVVSRQGNLVVETSRSVTTDELRALLREAARRQGRPYGLLFRDISGGFTNTQRMGPQAFKVLPILVYRVWVDGRPDELVRGADLVGTPLASLSKIIATANDYQTFNGYCGAESGFVPVSATAPSMLVEQLEVERKDKGSEKPPILPPPPLVQAAKQTTTGGRP